MSNVVPGDAEPEPARRFVEVVEGDGRTRWKIDAGFLTSSWTCIWGRGCQGIHDERRPELLDGCCSVGVALADEEEAMTVAALGASLDPGLFQHADVAPEALVARRGTTWSTRVVEGACVFLNRPGFPGGAGCALHLAAVAEGDDPADWKPQTCWKIPLRTEERQAADGVVEVTVRAWRREDWGPGGSTMAWWCTEAPEAFVGDGPLYERLGPELDRLFGPELHRLVRRALAAGDGADPVAGGCS